ncbi:MAG: aspartate--tRNA ligase [Candidatus Fischerbacteria bacterium RBG_13_37_8]|uniref:Aspartate--tRNA ligase n=1 Tax=Candidatus Fischerbacteria bacterium RBG_13_37_8 TaxID=1817863 RepID=A0A1F5VXU4_9BACT|nr:MAG: aspartate--tRNA ligase [Candidatus Fischerbacteria bacterium RBG_13_37_8]
MKRTNYCGNLSGQHIGTEVVLCGWVNRMRDLGSLCFIELRDREGTVQIVFNPQLNEELFKTAKELNNEYVVEIKGTVAGRSPENINPQLPTGEIEIIARELKILNESRIPPFAIMDEIQVTDNIRMKYRYIDLRRKKMYNNLKLRSDIVFAMRDFLVKEGFLEVETPILTKSTPEGARDYLVPSRIHKNKMYALPQSPQLFKQILMISGIDKYFQIPKCFRDEDLRADRQPEFTQVDIEMSFLEEEDIYTTMERLFKHVFAAVHHEIKIPFKRITFQEAMENYGTDKPDLRFECRIINAGEELSRSEFKVFKDVAGSSGVILALRVQNCVHYSRKDLAELEEYAKKLGAAGLIWAKKENGSVKSPIAKYISEEIWNTLFARIGFEERDLLLIMAGNKERSYEIMGQIRLYLAEKESWAKKDEFAFVWITNFPLFEYSEEEKRWVSKHHPFTSPRYEELQYLENETWKIHALAYDVVLNGLEIGGGSIRIHDPKLQWRIFRALGLSEEEIEQKFGFFVEALNYGAPPHGGIALGLDRIVMIVAHETSIRDVIPFPKTTKAQCLLTQSPSEVSKQQLKELGIEFIDDEINRE